jgi:hypothetical protein
MPLPVCIVNFANRLHSCYLRLAQVQASWTMPLRLPVHRRRRGVERVGSAPRFIVGIAVGATLMLSGNSIATFAAWYPTFPTHLITPVALAGWDILLLGYLLILWTTYRMDVRHRRILRGPFTGLLVESSVVAAGFTILILEDTDWRLSLAIGVWASVTPLAYFVGCDARCVDWLADRESVWDRVRRRDRWSC